MIRDFNVCLRQVFTTIAPKYSAYVAAFAVVQRPIPPSIAEETNPFLNQLLLQCSEYEPSDRPDFNAIITFIEDNLSSEMGERQDVQ